ncbi:efflux RND transporter periplasmic adaptor subunit [Cypionkella sp.]|uniref:efflux RND transporter periplasmic adaptor subunit n=1 Tax=Cypionkella sp. TaxID=2811411 RepID=UPI003753AA36
MGANIARSTLEAQDRGLQSARQEVARMTALINQARISLENRTLRAPLAASVLALNVEPGQVVDPATVVLALADLGDLLVEANVDESYAMQIKPAQTAVLQLAGESTTRSGKVGFVSSRVNALTGGLAIKIGFDAAIAAPVRLTVTANIVVDARPAALSVPQLAVTRVVGQDGVITEACDLTEGQAISTSQP